MELRKVAFRCSILIGIVGVFCGNLNLFSWTTLASICIVAVCYRKRLNIIRKTLIRDLRSLKVLRKTYKFLAECDCRDITIMDLFHKQLINNPQKPVFYFEDQTWSFSDIEAFSNKIANTLYNEGFRKGDAIALVMENRVEYIGIWFGLAKIGIISALINTGLTKQSLRHCLAAAEVKAVVYSDECKEAVEEIDIGSIKKYKWGNADPHSCAVDLKTLTENMKASVPVPKTEIHYRDKVVYVYTSGTTGLPKAAIIAHHRLIVMSVAMTSIIGIGEKDVVYNPLPLYHTAGGLLGVVGPITSGYSCVIKKKFSASAFWPDCIKYNCTVAHYIGEMCRYVMMVPPRPEDTQHKVKFIIGNGMKISLWTPFKERFKLDRICEIYGSTEGNVNLVNLDQTVGAVGFLPRIIPEHLVPMTLIKTDEFGEPIRNEKGFCVRCAPNEPGMFIGMITSTDATREYSGYVGDKKESEKKVIRNVFKEGDKAFLSGDIMVMDDLGYLYFKDRTGDTYRWKGENVSTAEVEGIVSSGAGLRDVLVYGVEVGNLEGRAGMATIVDPDRKLDLDTLKAFIDKNLPSYSRPLFLRLTDHVNLTGTFKLKKLNFQKEGFDPEKIKDKLYFASGDRYVELTKELYQDIVSGRLRI